MRAARVFADFNNFGLGDVTWRELRNRKQARCKKGRRLFPRRGESLWRDATTLMARSPSPHSQAS